MTLVGPRADAQRFQTTIFTETEGLPSSKILDLRQDETGRLWVLTRAGLSVYDGQGFATQRSGEPLREIVALAHRSERGPVVLGSGGPGRVAEWNGRSWTFLPELPPGGSAEPGGRAMLETMPGAGSRSLLLARPDGGFLAWDGERWRQPANPPAGSPSAMLPQDDSLIVGTRDGLFRVDQDWVFRRILGTEVPAGQTVLALAEARSGGWWILTPSWLGRVDGDSVQRVLARDGGDGLRLPAFAPTDRTAMVDDGFGGIFFGTSHRGYHLGLAKRHLRPVGTAEGLAAEGAVAFLRDREGGTWVASGRGLTRIASQRFVSFGRAQGLLEPEVTAILELGRGRMLLGHNIGFTYLDGDRAETVRFAPTPDRIARVLDLARDPSGRLWAAASGYGIVVLDTDGRRRRFGPEEGFGIAQSVEVAPDGSVWVASDDTLYTYREGRFEAVPLPLEAGAWIRWITFVGEDLFLSTDRGIVHRPHPDADWQIITHPDPSVANIYRMLRDRAERLWVGTEAGLFRVDQGALVRADLGGSPIERPVFFIVEDPANSLWFGTDNGVFVWDGASLRHLTVRHGLAGRETNRGAALVDSRGKVWIGTESGASVYQAGYDVRSVSRRRSSSTG